MDPDEIESFWADARVKAGLNASRPYFGPNALDSVTPPAWSFGADAAQADALLRLVLEGVKTATASALWDYEAEGDEVPTPGELSIVLDSAGHPQALLHTTSVRVVPFDEVDEAHAYAEGEGDRTLRYWREVHRRFFTEHASHDRGFADDMPVVLEEFEVLVPRGVHGRERPGVHGREQHGHDTEGNARG
ncbi:ASCH domain-containing protein [Mobilicoccus pelagius]|uniref:ASCH domain-containing protein n=1 Tax=Mobilicoccus pelagius NBRC 104925 TaxID=1089455 RepID=H5UQM1_9MICO|nr:ASCH domain-containing protein [Mobilicoccus pelagius]GAB48029.1 hypothetical protein MOPEL_032_00720 [Mobilicoccus pelagius NBRC 104925]